jgi:hypothetical protein
MRFETIGKGEDLWLSIVQGGNQDLVTKGGPSDRVKRRIRECYDRLSGFIRRVGLQLLARELYVAIIELTGHPSQSRH